MIGDPDLPFDTAEFAELVSKRFGELTHPCLPEKLFHYTDQVGLLGIVSNGEFWASKIQYMNDSTELEIALSLTSELLSERTKTINDHSEKDVLEKISNSLDKLSNINVCAVSFCENPDLLSQWRGYGGGNAGYSIGFKSNRLQQIADHHDGRLGRCIYSRDDQTTIINELFDGVLLSVARDNSSSVSIVESFQKKFLKYAAFFKHDSFSEEREWRLVTKVNLFTDAEFSFRSGKSMLVPFFKLSFARSEIDNWETDLPLVTVGPCPHPEASRAAVTGLLLKYGIIETVRAPYFKPQRSEVLTSLIPFRNW